MKKLLIVNNIPTPYRTFMFNKFHEKGRDYGVEVSVMFQARRESRRPWKPEDFDMRFPHIFSRGFLGRPGTAVEFHRYTLLNRDIIAAVGSGLYDWVLAAPFLSLTGWVLSLLPTRTLKLLWSEGNVDAARHMSAPARLWKRVLHMRYDALACPGKKAVEYIRSFAPAMGDRPVLWLPNIVDTRLFVQRVNDLRPQRDALRAALKVMPDQVLILAIGQLVERKGYDRLIESAARVAGSYQVLVLGDGPLRGEYEERIRSLGIGGRVRLCGQVAPEEVARYFAAADWFIHPSLADSSPLVVVEAATAGLALAVSDQSGNSPEAVEPGVNGFTFDASSRADVEECLGRLLAVPPDLLERMKNASAELSRRNFDPDLVVSRFFEGMLALPERKNSKAGSS